MENNSDRALLISGTSKGIGRFLAEYYLDAGYRVIGCSRSPSDLVNERYRHFCLDVSDEPAVRKMFAKISKEYGRLDVSIHNAGIASMNHILLTPLATAKKIMDTNVIGTFLFCREAAKVMKKNNYGRIINFATVASPLKLEGEALYACSKAAVANMTEIVARELAEFGITVNAVGPTPVKTDLIRSVPEDKMSSLIARQAIRRFGEFEDISNVVDFLIKPESDFVTGQVIYLGGV
jgi:3-oxoacyl-[acyl-carrier protein] reductase